MSLTGPFYSDPSGVGEAANSLWVEVGTTLPPLTQGLRLSVQVALGAGVSIWLPARKPDSNGRVRWELGELVRDATADAVTVPPVGGTQVIGTAGVLLLWGVVRMREVSGDPPAITDEVINLPQRLAIRGGTPADVAAGGVRYFGTGGYHQTNGLPFMDWRGGEVRTAIGQDQWLGMVPWDVPGGFTANPNTSYALMVRLLWEDGTSDIETHQAIDILSLGIQGWLLPAGHDQLDIAGYEAQYDKRALAYEVWVQITDPDLEWSERKLFVIDRGYYEFTTEMQYRNGFGVWTQLLLRGRPVVETDCEREEARTYHTDSMGTHVGEMGDLVTRVRNGRELASGFLSAAEMRLVGELVAADIVMVKVANVGWVRVAVDAVRHEDDAIDTARRVDISYRYDYEDRVANMF